jgi:hypothetical protein
MGQFFIWTTSSPPHRRLALATGAVALSAYAGAAGLIAGGIDLGKTVTGRIPWQSPPLAGAALLVAVAVPMTVASVEAWRGGRWADESVLASATALVAWLGAQVGFIRTLHWLQPAYLAVALAIGAAGLRVRAGDIRQATRSGRT